MFTWKGKMYWKKPLNVLMVSALTAGLWSTALAPQTAKAAADPSVPGGASTKPVLWLKADDGATDAADILTGWTDQTGTNNFTVVGSPKYKANGINFNPVVTFSGNLGNREAGALHKLVGDKQITYADAYIVLNKAKGVAIGSSTGGANYGPAIFSNEDYFYAAGNGANSTYTRFAFPSGAQPRMANADIGGLKHEARLDGVEQSLRNQASFTPIQITPVIASTLSKNNGTNYANYNGEIAEVILYSGSTASDRAKIETYLAVKYGITLGNGKTDYIATNGSTVWAADNTYKNNIAGIGQDDDEGFIQKQSRSVNTGTQVTISVGSLAETNAANTGTLENGQYLIWGDNGKELTFSKQIGTTNKNHAERIWKVENTGEVGEVQIAIPKSKLPVDATLRVGNSDTDFTNAVEYSFTEVLFEGESYFTTKAPLASGQYFTFVAPAPVPESARLGQTQTNGNQITLSFDQEVALTDLTGFIVKVDGTPIDAGVTFIVDPTDAKKLILTLPTGTVVTSNTVNVSYDGTGNLKRKNADVKVNDFSIDAVNKFELQAKVTGINGENLVEEIYTATSWAALQSKLTEAQAVLDNPTATQQQVNAALAALTAARSGLQDVPPINKSALQAKVTEINGENLVEENYTPTSWTVLQTKLTEAEVVLNDPAATQQQVNDALVALTAARSGLQNAGSQVDKSALQARVTGINGENLVEENYTATSWAALQTKLTEAQAVLDNPTSIQQQVDDALSALTAARSGLQSTANQSALTGLQLNSWNGTPIGISPNFNSGTIHYSASVTNSVYGVTIHPAALDPDAKIEVSVNHGAWQEVPNSGNSGNSGNLLLNVGMNTIVVKVTDAKGNVTEYTLNVSRASSGSGSNGGSTDGSAPTPTKPPVKPEESGIDTSVNGKDDNFATGKTSTSGDRTSTSVQVDQDKLNKALSQGNGQKLVIHSSKDGDVKVDGLTAGIIKQLADRGASLEISNPLAIYPVPGGKMDLSGVSKQVDNAPLSDIAVHIDIARSSDNLINNAKNKAKAEGYELLVTPVDLDLTFSNNGKTVRLEQLSGYAAKYIALPEGIDPNRITTGVIVNPDGSVYHVPTVVTKISNRYYAMINDLRSQGSYSVIWNPQDFDDVKKHWGKVDVNNIAARLDLAGNGDNTFSPDRNVTRSEFSEIVVMGLGLMRQKAPQNMFPDISASTWYRNSVAIANEFDIVRGYSDGNFYGNQQITREQGIAMIARAYNLIERKAALSQERIDSLLATYEDAASVSSWAQADVARMIEAGIVQGNGLQLLSPKAKMTRAEVAALIARMLTISNLIDK